MKKQIPCPWCKALIDVNLDLMLQGVGSPCMQCGGMLNIAKTSLDKVNESVRALRELA